MAVPKKRKTKSRQGERRSHDALKAALFSKCQKCGNTVMPHRICENCGTYKNREIVDVFAKLDKKEKKKRQKEQAEYEKSQESGRGTSMEQLSKK